MTARHLPPVAAIVLACILDHVVSGQPYDVSDLAAPGDRMIQRYLRRHADQIHDSFFHDVASLEDWQTKRGRFQQEYLYMLGLEPLPQKSPLRATVTGTLPGDGFIVDMIHYQSIPGLYVTGNLYRPSPSHHDERLPAVLYVCGHSSRGRNGNKTAFQSHGIWFARHGYVCLVIDTLQLGEIAGVHHGTYREGRWWWHSRGYTPAGVECWNGVRGIDYLISRSDVDAERIGVTGISGGGAATFWIAAADERVKVAVPVSGMADLPSYVTNRVINGHCDCMFLYNTFRWPWTRIAGLIAPRPLLFVNSDQDSIFPMDANERVINRLERLYSLYGRGDFVDSVVSIGGHAYRRDIRQAAYRFIDTHLKNEPTVVLDSEVDLVASEDDSLNHPIDPEKLRVFPVDEQIPGDQLNTTIDEHFVPMAKVTVPTSGTFTPWKSNLLTELRRVTFRGFPEHVPAAKLLEATSDVSRLETEPGIRVELRIIRKPDSRTLAKRYVIVIASPESTEPLTEWLGRATEAGDEIYLCSPRGDGGTKWTRKDPPNYVERSLVLLGQTVDTGRVRDVIATVRYMMEKRRDDVPVYVAGEGHAAVLASYAALLEPEIAGAVAVKPEASHMSVHAPRFLNVLRVCDVAHAMGMIAPRRLEVFEADLNLVSTIASIYGAADASEQFTHR